MDSSNKMSSLQRMLTFIYFVAFLAILLAGQAYSSSYELLLDISTYLQGGGCQDSVECCLGTTYPEFIVSVKPVGRDVSQQDYVGITDWTWPAGMQVVAGSYQPQDSSFTPDSALTRQLNFRYYVSNMDSLDDVDWRSTGSTPSSVMCFPRFNFITQLPENLNGQRICIQVTYNSERYGNLVSGSPFCFPVLQPCSAEDTASIRFTILFSTYQIKDWPLYLLIHDSLRNLGYTTIEFLGDASFAARRLGQYDRAIAYLDTCFHSFGSISPFGDSSGTSQDTSKYLQERNMLLQEKAEHGRK